MRKASYTDRKLTVEEQDIAEKYIGVLEKFVRIKHFTPREEWIEKFSVAYIQAIKKYTDYERLHCYKIEAIIFKSLEGAASNYYRKMNCMKRKPQKKLISYDNSKDKKSIPCSKETTSYLSSTEKVAMGNLMLYEIFQKIQIEQQKRIVIMLIEGYKKVEIQRYFNITYYRLQKEIESVRKIMEYVYLDA